MKKISYFVILILFLTGCTCEYNLTIDDNFIESTTINFTSKEEKDYFLEYQTVPVDYETYRLLLSIPPAEDGVANPKLEYTGDNYKAIYRNSSINYSHNFDQKSLQTSTAISTCYDTYNVTSVDESLIISTSNLVKCFDNNKELTELTINIKTSKEVINSNSDSVKNNTYTWNINRNNYQNKPVNITIKTPYIINNDEEKVNEISYNKYDIYIYLGGLLVIVLIVYYIVKRVKEKSNDNTIDE